MNTSVQSSSILYGDHMFEYGGDVDIGSMMALMIAHQLKSKCIMTSISIPKTLHLIDGRIQQYNGGF